MQPGGHDGEALDAVEHVLALKPNHAAAWNLKGYILSALGRHREQLAACERALELKPNLARNWANKAEALTGLGRYADALAACERGLAITPKDRFALYAKAEALEAMQRYEEALAIYDDLIAARHRNIARDCWHGKGSVLFKMGRYQEAASALQQATLLDPDAAGSWQLLAQTLRALGLRREAQEAQRKADAAERRMQGPDADAAMEFGLRADAREGSGSRRPMSDADLARRAISPVCTFCRWWRPDRRRHCDAYPLGGPEIPDPIWEGKNLHLTPDGSEARNASGQPYVFVLHPEVDTSGDNSTVPVIAAYLAAHPSGGQGQ